MGTRVQIRPIPWSSPDAYPQWRQPITITSLGEMAQPTYGTHRVKNPGLEDGVWITDGKNGFEIPESRYRENGYKPRVEELPWRSSTWEGGSPVALAVRSARPPRTGI